MRSLSLSLSLSAVLIAPLARANPGACPGSESAAAVYDPGTGEPPELASPPWTLTGTDGSLVEVVPADGVPVLRITDDDMPSGGGECAPGAGEDETTAWALPTPELGAASVYGIEAQVRVPFECTDAVTGEGSGKALFGLVDGEVIVVAVVGGPGHPGVAFLDVLADAPLGEPILFEPGFTTALHAYTLRCERGLGCDIFVDGGAAPVLTASYAAMTPLSALPPDFPLAPYAQGVFAFGSQTALSEWAGVEVALCEGDAIDVAKAAIEATAAQVVALFPAKPAKEVRKKLDKAVDLLARAQVKLDQGKVCKATKKITKAGKKVEKAAEKTEGFATCPGGKHCVDAGAKETVLASLAVDATLVENAKIATCALDPACEGCPPPPVVQNDITCPDDCTGASCPVPFPTLAKVVLEPDYAPGDAITARLGVYGHTNCTIETNPIAAVIAIDESVSMADSSGCCCPDPADAAGCFDQKFEVTREAAAVIAQELLASSPVDNLVSLVTFQTVVVDSTIGLAIEECCSVPSTGTLEIDCGFEFGEEECAWPPFCTFTSSFSTIAAAVGPFGSSAGGTLPFPDGGEDIVCPLTFSIEAAKTTPLPTQAVFFFTDGTTETLEPGQLAAAVGLATDPDDPVLVFPFCAGGSCGAIGDQFVDLVEMTTADSPTPIDIDEDDPNLCNADGSGCPCIILGDTIEEVKGQLLCLSDLLVGPVQPVRNVRVFERISDEYDVVDGSCTCSLCMGTTCIDTICESEAGFVAACDALETEVGGVGGANVADFPSIPELGDGSAFLLEFQATAVPSFACGQAACPSPNCPALGPDVVCVEDDVGATDIDKAHVAFNWEAPGCFPWPECPGFGTAFCTPLKYSWDECDPLPNAGAVCSQPPLATEKFFLPETIDSESHWAVTLFLTNQRDEPLTNVRLNEALSRSFQWDRTLPVSGDLGDPALAVVGSPVTVCDPGTGICSDQSIGQDGFYEYMRWGPFDMEACETVSTHFLVQPLTCAPDALVDRLVVDRANVHPSLTAAHVTWEGPSGSPLTPIATGCLLLPSKEASADAPFPGVAACGLPAEKPEREAIDPACIQTDFSDGDLAYDGVASVILPDILVARDMPERVCGDTGPPLACCFLPSPAAGYVTDPFKAAHFSTPVTSVGYCVGSPVVACAGDPETTPPDGPSCDPLLNPPCCAGPTAGCYLGPACCTPCLESRIEGLTPPGP